MSSRVNSKGNKRIENRPDRNRVLSNIEKKDLLNGRP
jgi:hypothetical protein